MTEATQTGKHARPWTDDEYIIVDGHKLCYDWDQGLLVVRFPGGVCALVSELLEQGRSVVMPRKVRK